MEDNNKSQEEEESSMKNQRTQPQLTKLSFAKTVSLTETKNGKTPIFASQPVLMSDDHKKPSTQPIGLPVATSELWDESSKAPKAKTIPGFDLRKLQKSQSTPSEEQAKVNKTHQMPALRVDANNNLIAQPTPAPETDDDMVFTTAVTTQDEVPAFSGKEPPKEEELFAAEEMEIEEVEVQRPAVVLPPVVVTDGKKPEGIQSLEEVDRAKEEISSSLLKAVTRPATPISNQVLTTPTAIAPQQVELAAPTKTKNFNLPTKSDAGVHTAVKNPINLRKQKILKWTAIGLAYLGIFLWSVAIYRDGIKNIPLFFQWFFQMILQSLHLR